MQNSVSPKAHAATLASHQTIACTEQKPWLGLYAPWITASNALQHSSIAEAWRARVLQRPEKVAIHYFDASLTTAEVDEISNAIARIFQERGVRRGDRVALYMQNTPYVPLIHLALWKLAAIGVPINPMYRGKEIQRLLSDSGAVGIVASDIGEIELSECLSSTSVRWLLSGSSWDFQTLNDPRVFQCGPAKPFSDGDLGKLIPRYDRTPLEPVPCSPEDTAFITYTSGTTGPPKGALNSHGNFLHSVSNFSRWIDLTEHDVVFAMAPLFHITGLSINAGLALLSGASLVLCERFHPEIALEQIVAHQATFTVGSITAYNSISSLDWADAHHFSSMRALYSGGAPIPPSIIEDFQRRFGKYIHNAWGMTETTAGGIAVPLGLEAPVHAPTGTLSIGVPMQNVKIRVIGADGTETGPGQEGELELSAPQVVSGYWQNEDATRATFPQGRLRTGDVAVVDREGWVYLVDRLKDQINVSGYKVWPREVEDTLYEHPAVFEAAVIGEADPYRGETVVAYVSLRPGFEIEPEELIAHTRERLAPYKCPRKVYFSEVLPKTATGKIQRHALRKD